MAEEAMNSFESLLTRIPLWIADIEGIVKASTERQTTSGSLERPSERSDKTVAVVLSTPPKAQYLHRSSRSLLSRASRSSTSNESPINPRSSRHQRKDKNSVHSRVTESSQDCPRVRRTIYFDGELQKHFETLVRAIGSARNTVRKGKMSAKVDALASCGDSDAEGASSDDDDDGARNSKPHHIDDHAYDSCPTPMRTFLSSYGRRHDHSAFDRVDKLLETAQLQCERAAHQVLRDGNVSTELDRAMQQLVAAQTLGQEQLPRLRKKASRSAQRQQRHEERMRIEEDEVVLLATSPLPPSKRLPQRHYDRLALNILAVPGALDALAANSTQSIEVDVNTIQIDADDDDLTSPMFGFPSPALLLGKSRTLQQRAGAN